MKQSVLLLAFVFLSAAAWAQKNKVIITTEYGKIEMELYDKTPKHRDNMIKLIKEKFYDGTLFHRVIPGFVIQGGDPDSKTATAGKQLGEGDVGYKIPAEINDEYYHQRGALAMARDNNPEKASSGCQFYIVVGKKFTDAELDQVQQRSGRKFTAEQRETYKTKGGVPHLDGGYTVFGMVTEGMDVVDKIVNEPRDASDRPNKDVKMLSVRMAKKKKHFLFF
ncbi:peptidylprolyl isomerase [Chitinophagaceae bacterium MMS25-I14]